MVEEESFKKFISSQLSLVFLSSLAIFKQGTVWSYSREGGGCCGGGGDPCCAIVICKHSQVLRGPLHVKAGAEFLSFPPLMCHRQWIGLNWKRGAMTPAPSCSRGATSAPSPPLRFLENGAGSASAWERSLRENSPMWFYVQPRQRDL